MFFTIFSSFTFRLALVSPWAGTTNIQLIKLCIWYPLEQACTEQRGVPLQMKDESRELYPDNCKQNEEFEKVDVHSSIQILSTLDEVLVANKYFCSSPWLKVEVKTCQLRTFLATGIYCISWVCSANKTKTKESPLHLENKAVLFPVFIIKTEECAYCHKQVTVRGTVQQLPCSCAYLPSKCLSIFCLSSNCSFKSFFWANIWVKKNLALFSAWSTHPQDDTVVICNVWRFKIL